MHGSLPAAELERVVAAALREDLPWGDLTTESLFPEALPARGAVMAKRPGVIAGLPVLEVVFRQLSPEVRVRLEMADGAEVERGQVVAVVEGDGRALLAGERVALNFLSHLSGIATLTRRYVQAVAGLPCRIVDTRKTAPGLRVLQKYAVRVGGGANHRFGLSDGVLVKDNHLAMLKRQGVSLRQALERLRARVPHGIRIQVEVTDLDQVHEAVEAGADALLFDNMDLQTLRQAVARCRGRVLTEASGGVTLETVRAVAETGVDLISVGALTHSAPALDLSLEIL
ncbi:MAG: carboxylating nicotinate-nucleotide diphosphorylase [Armatimonadota bacterium]|nr:carboxylating nicotinate-nucleotide diphosphorylase [Armatimonadota bacterium]MDR5688731.1 carboxylating nicotinate-nucleotide diphosphorylase [Armatimonadota bacterium]MDR7400481.1 carboxylating nicotinate-nucleotide diphosphorylase [Armatimonadota bacterium]MDR7425829.1 carboxylating nicotinate-nucleotide diphosphorylase [Armatimonadota bacterium]MDR7581764.1 carboxylating nicotinate-nucleotide diphosphorylase [Armatimonadota bacterium]